MNDLLVHTSLGARDAIPALNAAEGNFQDVGTCMCDEGDTLLLYEMSIIKQEEEILNYSR